jgi:hypothetical protein
VRRAFLSLLVVPVVFTFVDGFERKVRRSLGGAGINAFSQREGYEA